MTTTTADVTPGLAPAATAALAPAGAVPGEAPGEAAAQTEAPAPAVNPEVQRRYGLFENNILNRKLGYAYLGVPKAANTSVKLALLKTVARSPADVINGHGIRRYLHDKNAGIYEYATREQIAGADPPLIFTVVRNPWDRIVSCYKNKITKKFHQPFADYGMTEQTTFEAFVDIIANVPDECAEIHFRSQVSLLHAGKRYLPKVTLFSHNLWEDWKLIQGFFHDRHGLAIDDITVENKTPSVRYRTLFSVRSRRLMARRYARDIEFFGFDF